MRIKCLRAQETLTHCLGHAKYIEKMLNELFLQPLLISVKISGCIGLGVGVVAMPPVSKRGASLTLRTLNIRAFEGSLGPGSISYLEGVPGNASSCLSSLAAGKIDCTRVQSH